MGTPNALPPRPAPSSTSIRAADAKPAAATKPAPQPSPGLKPSTSNLKPSTSKLPTPAAKLPAPQTSKPQAAKPQQGAKPQPAAQATKSVVATKPLRGNTPSAAAGKAVVPRPQIPRPDSSAPSALRPSERAPVSMPASRPLQAVASPAPLSIAPASAQVAHAAQVAQPVSQPAPDRAAPHRDEAITPVVPPPSFAEHVGAEDLSREQLLNLLSRMPAAEVQTLLAQLQKSEAGEAFGPTEDSGARPLPRQPAPRQPDAYRETLASSDLEFEERPSPPPSKPMQPASVRPPSVPIALVHKRSEPPPATLPSASLAPASLAPVTVAPVLSINPPSASVPAAPSIPVPAPSAPAPSASLQAVAPASVAPVQAAPALAADAFHAPSEPVRTAIPVAAPASSPMPTAAPVVVQTEGKPRLSIPDPMDILFEAIYDLSFLETAVEGGSYCLTALLRALSAKAGIVHLYDMDARDFAAVYAQGPGAEQLLGQHVSEEDWLISAAIANQRPLIMNYDNGGSPRERHAIFGAIRSVIVAPVMSWNRCMGIIELVDPLSGGQFDGRATHAVTYVAEQYAQFLSERGVFLPKLVAPSAI